MQKSTLILLTCSLLFLFSCKKDSNSNPTDSENLITATVGGILTKGNVPFVNATVNIGNESRLTDENGAFWFKDIQVPESRTYITVEEPEYYFGSRTIYPTEGSTNFVRIALLKKRSRGIISSSAGGEVSWSWSAKIVFPENAFVTQSGNSYNGDVNIMASYLKPDLSRIGNYTPGDLSGVNSIGENVILATYGMMVVELVAEDGSLLQLANGKEAELHFPKLTGLLEDAPNTIPLWYFDEQEGIWKEEGQAELVGEQYIGKVSHFSFWNCDDPYRLVTIQGSLVTETNIPISHAKVELTMQSTAEVGYGYTNEQGIFTGNVPAGELFNAEIFNECNELLFETTLGPFNSDKLIDPIVAENVSMHIKGQLVDCNSNNVNNGYVKIEWEYNSVIIKVENGQFDAALVACDGVEVTISACDVANSKLSPPVTFVAQPSIDLGLLTACDEDLDGYITWTIEPYNHFIRHPNGYEFTDDNKVYLNGFETSKIGFIIDGLGTGTFDIETDSEFFEGIDPGANFTSLKAIVTKYEGIGGYIEGAFAGFYDSGKEIVGQFKVSVKESDLCATSAPFSGEYLVEQISGDGGFSVICGPEVVELHKLGVKRRAFSPVYLPDIGGFETEPFIFSLECGEIVFEDWDSGLACGSGSILIQGDTPNVTYDPEDDSVIYLNVIDYVDDGGCGFDPIPSVLRLTKQ